MDLNHPPLNFKFVWTLVDREVVGFESWIKFNFFVQGDKVLGPVASHFDYNGGGFEPQINFIFLFWGNKLLHPVA